MAEPDQRSNLTSVNGNSDTGAEPRRSILQSVDSLTLAIEKLTVKLDTFMTLQQKAIPYPVVLIMFLIVIGVLFGVGAMQKFEILKAVG